MARVKRGVTARRRHKKILKLAKGYYNARRKVFRVAKQAVVLAVPRSNASALIAPFLTVAKSVIAPD